MTTLDLRSREATDMTTPPKLGDRTPMPTPADVEAVLDGLLAGTSDFAKWLVLVNQGKQHVTDDEIWVGRQFYWAEVLDDEGNPTGEFTGGGHTPVEAAAAAWVIMCLGRFPSRISKQDYERVPRRIHEGWSFELFALPATREGRWVS